MQQPQILRTPTAELPAVDAAKKLAGVIGKSSVFQNYEKALQELRGNDDAQRLFSEYRQAQEVSQMMRSWNGTTDDDERQIRKKEEQVLSNPILKNYFQAQEELVKTLKEVNVLISERLGIDFANATKPAGGCC